MREIKFRAWVQQKDGYVWADSTHVYSDGSWGYDMDDEVYVSIGYEGLFGDKLMQYTGLKDKNGVEIYEGDVVCYETTKAEDDLIGEMRWSEKVAKFGMRDKGETVVYGVQADDVAKRMKVIGNIYENPELLEGKE